LHRAEGAGAEEPPEQFRAALAQRVVQALLEARAETVERKGEAGDAYLAYGMAPSDRA
jgi:hypothetical protein